MQNKSRTDNFVKNTVIGMCMQVLSIILAFTNRTIFIKLLTNDYLSINGLFSNILNTLSAVELGFGMALIYMMYKPVAENNKEKIKTIVKFYKKVYAVIGILILLLGILVIPFMKFIIKNPPVISENLNFIYILFLINTCIGYFWSHKIALINAYQQNYITSLYSQIFKWLQTILQIIILIITKNYILYLIIQLICSLLYNIVISRKCNKLFPFIKEKSIQELSKKEKDEVSSKVKSLIFYRLNPSILNGSDNIIISSFVGLSFVGLYSNYYLLTNYLIQFIEQITRSMESGIGNLNAIESANAKEKAFYKILYICFFIYGIITVLFMALSNNFINIWLGSKYLLTPFVVFTIVLYIYINGVHTACYSFRTTSGLFEKNKLVPLYEVIINIIASIILAKYLGLAGVFLGTSIARLTTFFWTDPKLLYKYLFTSKNKKNYYLKYIYYLIITLSIGLLVYYLSTIFVATNYIFWFIKAFCLGILTLLLFSLLTFKTKEFKELSSLIIQKYFKKRSDNNA